MQLIKMLINIYEGLIIAVYLAWARSGTDVMRAFHPVTLAGSQNTMPRARDQDQDHAHYQDSTFSVICSKFTSERKPWNERTNEVY